MEKLINLFGREKAIELNEFMNERNLIPNAIEEIPKIDDQLRYIIHAEGSKIELSDGSFVPIGVSVYVTYNEIKNRFTYMEYADD